MARALIVILSMISLFFMPNQAVADMYKWVDQNGVVHYSDAPPASGEKAKTIKTPNYQSESPSPAPVKPAAYTKAVLKGPPPTKVIKKKKRKSYSGYNVEIFTTRRCKYCRRALAFLRSHRIKFKQYDIHKDPKAAPMMYALGGTGGVPFAIINGKKVPGFSAKKYKQALGLK